jgi:argininosuccinate synthase
MKKIMLAYSGGLDTSVILTWLRERYGLPVVAFIADVGQGEPIQEIARKALRTGASQVRVADLREEFVSEYVFTALRMNAVYEGVYLMGTALARPVIARHLVRAALEDGCDAIAHGATGKGNDQVRFELAVKALAPELQIIAPWREWEMTSRPDLIDYAERHGIELPVTRDKPWSIDANLMHISYEGGVLEDPWCEPPAGMFRLTVDPERAPDDPESVEVDFEAGIPVAFNGERLSPAALLEAANALAGAHGIGRVDLVENRFVGMKSRGVYETPGMTLLMAAHRAVESLTLDREVMHLRDQMMPRFAEMVYYGFWFSPEMALMRGFIEASQKDVCGTARLKLYKGSVTLLGRRSERSLYDAQVAGFDTFADYNSRDAGGLIAMNALRLRLNPALREQSEVVHG